MDDDMSLEPGIASIMEPLMSGPDPEYGHEVELAMKMIQAGSTVDEFVDYAQENDLDVVDMDSDDLDDLSHDEMIVVYAFSALANGLSRLNELDDDNDDNPFKVSDGDDPVY